MLAEQVSRLGMHRSGTSALGGLRGERSTRNSETEQLRQENLKLAAFSEHQSLEVRGFVAKWEGLARAHTDLIADGLLRDRERLIGEGNALLALRRWRLTAPLRRMRTVPPPAVG
jgi:hypothetical protein